MQYLDQKFSQELMQTHDLDRVEKLVHGARLLYEKGNTGDGASFLRAAIQLADSLEKRFSTLAARRDIAFDFIRYELYAEASDAAANGYLEAQSVFELELQNDFAAIWAEAEYLLGNLATAQSMFGGLKDSEGLSREILGLSLRRLADIKNQFNADYVSDWQSALDLAFESGVSDWIGECAIGLASRHRKNENYPEAIENLKYASNASLECSSWWLSLKIGFESLLCAKGSNDPEFIEIAKAASESHIWTTVTGSASRGQRMLRYAIDIAISGDDKRILDKHLFDYLRYMRKVEPDLIELSQAYWSMVFPKTNWGLKNRLSS